MQPLLECRDIRKKQNQNLQYDTLEGLNLSVSVGEFLCMVGKTGCGKTTLLRIMCGFVKQDSGEMLLKGSAVEAPSSDAVMVFQEGALFPWLDVVSNVEFGLKMKGVPPDSRREIAARYLDMVEMGEYAPMRISDLSTGMKHRVAIARALALDPDVLFLDEPFAALDGDTTNMLRDSMAKIWKNTGKTVIMVTHDPLDAAVLGTRVIRLAGKPAKIVQDYPNDLSFPRDPSDAKAFAEKMIDDAKRFA